MSDIPSMLSVVGLPACPRCNVIVSHAHRFKKELSACKKRLMLVADVFFALKSGATKMRNALEDNINGKVIKVDFNLYFIFLNILFQVEI